VAFLLRDKGDYTLTLPPDITILIDEFKAIPPPSQLSPLAMTRRWDAYSLKVIEILMSVWTRTWDPYHGNNNNIWDPTMCFVALAAIKADHSWAQAVDITPILARLVYGMRTIFLLSLHLGDVDTAVVRERHDKLEKWHYEGNDSTFHSLCSLQHLASDVAFQTPSFPAFTWYGNNDTEFIWHGSLITLHMFRSFGQELMQSVYERFEKVTFGMWRQIQGYVADDLSNSTPGYGFVSDRRNEKYYNKRHLLDLIMDKPHLRDEFVIALAPDGVPLLNLSRLRSWLVDYSTFLLHFMAALTVGAGSPSRGTEITCMQIRNTASRTRGLYMIGRRMAIVAQYSKTSATKGHDTLIPHILDAFCQEIAKVIVFQTHPFAEKISMILFPDRQDLLTLWRTNLFVNFDSLFTTEDLSGVFRLASLKTMDISIGVRDYRQMSVCVRRTHCPKLNELTASLDDEDPASVQAGHTRATEERLYGVSVGYLGKLPENMVEPFAKASGEWQRFMHMPEGGTDIKLREFTVKEVWKRYLAPVMVQPCCRCVCH